MSTLKVTICDTEVTSLYNPAERIVQLGVIRLVLSSEHPPLVTKKYMSLIRTERRVHPDAQKVHGISNDMTRYSPHEAVVMDQLCNDLSWCNLLVGHNIDFDNKFIKDAFLRHALIFPDCKIFDTMKESVGHCCIPPTERMKRAGRLGYKNPKLEEAYEHFTGRKMSVAHDALADVEATKEVFLALVKIKSTGKFMLD